LNDLKIPHATLLDLDLGRIHGGTKLVHSAVKALKEIGNDLSMNPCVELGDTDLADLHKLKDTDLCNEDNVWLQTLRFDGAYFSHPIDLDFSMLKAFPSEYQQPHSSGLGPHGDPKSIQSKKHVTLKTGGNPALFDASHDDLFKWYPYLFLSRSKPETHLTALSRIKKKNLGENAPPEIKALIDDVKQILAI